MFKKSFIFGDASGASDNIRVKAQDLYTEELGYGFVIEKNRRNTDVLKILEINAGFEPWYWLKDKDLTRIDDGSYGCSILENEALPLIFKCNVPHPGNYNVTVTIEGGVNGQRNVMIFSERRRLMDKISEVPPYSTYEITFTANVCNIIPRGIETEVEDFALDIAVLSESPTITAITIEETEVKTIYIAGDSTLTDQSGAYPYNPGCCYSGWAQMLPAFLNQGIGVSNHAHSGLTTESFRMEGHYEIIKRYIKPGDYFYMQFGHNDQKLPHLQAYKGYKENIKNYILEMKKLLVTPVLITPLARNTWKPDGSYNDLLLEFGEACIQIGNEMGIKVLDLHGLSKSFVISEGLEWSKNYFFPKDYTHTNDYGAYLMAEVITKECLRTQVAGIKDFIRKDYEAFIPPMVITMPIPPKGFDNEIQTSAIEEEIVRPNEKITRVEAIDFLIKVVRFVPTNVYNDRFTDVIGHEWYAGIVEVACQNNLVDDCFTKGGLFQPMATVTMEEFITFCMTSYGCRKVIGEIPELNDIFGVSDFAKEAVKQASFLGILPNPFEPKHELTRAEGVNILKKLERVL